MSVKDGIKMWMEAVYRWWLFVVGRLAVCLSVCLSREVGDDRLGLGGTNQTRILNQS